MTKHFPWLSLRNAKEQSNLTKYRTALMGIGAIGVLATHSCEFVQWPGPLLHVFAYGGLGVYFFMFLSGVGLYHAMSQRRSTKSAFYQRRFIRVFLPYLLISACWYGIKYLLCEKDLGMFLYELSTLSYWLEHKGAWYVAALAPIYLLYPFYFDWVERGHRGLKTAAALLAIWTAETVSYLHFNTFYRHLAQVMDSLWVFILGHYCAEGIRQKGSNCTFIFPVFIAAFALEKLLPLHEILPIGSMMYAFKGVLMLILCAWVLHILRIDLIHRLLKWFGNHSLALYLTNIYVIQAVKYFNIGESINAWLPQSNGLLLYGIIVLAGILLSVIFDRLAAAAAKKIQL